MLGRTALRRFAAAWVLALIVASLQPERPEHIHEYPLRHQVLHVLIFAATAVVVLSLCRQLKDEWLGAFALVGLACAIETAQFLIYRFPEIEWWDIREDSIGIAVGFAVIHFTGARSLLLAEAKP